MNENQTNIEYIDEFDEKEIDKIIGYSDDAEYNDNTTIDNTTINKTTLNYVIDIILLPFSIIKRTNIFNFQ